MIATTDDLRHTLSTIDHALTALCFLGVSADASRFDEICRLEAGRKAIAIVLDTRRRQSGQKVVSLEDWRKDTFAVSPLKPEPPVETAAELLLYPAHR